MSVIQLPKDREKATMTITVALDATVEQVWQLFADPRKLEKWWGPPTWPATFADFNLAAGEEAHYYMTGPDGEKAGGWWKFLKVQEPSVIELTDGFADEDGKPDTKIEPMRMVATFAQHGGAVHLEMVSYCKDSEHFDQMMGMGFEQGLAGALSQMDALVS